MKRIVLVLSALILFLVSTNWCADFFDTFEKTVTYRGINHTIHQYRLTPDGDWSEYKYVDTVIIKYPPSKTAADTVIVSCSVGTGGTAAVACSLLALAVNASDLASYLTAHDSGTYVRLFADDSDYQIVKVSPDTGQTVAKVLPGSNVRRRDTTYLQLDGYHPSSFISTWIGYNYDGFADMATSTSCSLFVVLQFGVDDNWDSTVTKNIRLDTMKKDSIKGIDAGWNLEKWLQTSDTLVKYDAVRAMFIRVYALKDTGASFLAKYDSTYDAVFEFIVSGKQ